MLYIINTQAQSVFSNHYESPKYLSSIQNSQILNFWLELPMSRIF